jgi:hypothetical protein
MAIVVSWMTELWHATILNYVITGDNNTLVSTMAINFGHTSDSIAVYSVN